MSFPASLNFQLPPRRSIVLIGMMGSGKTAVGRRLASRLNLPFADSDVEIETAAGMSIAAYFSTYGEAAFRIGERKVLARLLQSGIAVISTGGGAFMDEETRQNIRAQAISIWLRAELDILTVRAARRDHRPLLQNVDIRQRLDELLVNRTPVYSQADLTVDSDNRPVEETVDRVITALQAFSASRQP